MDRIRQHFCHRRRSSSAGANLQSPIKSPDVNSNVKHNKGQESPPRRLYLTSDTSDFDRGIIRRFQGEGFEVEYVPFLCGNEDVERDRKQLENLLHERQDDLEPGERFAVVAYNRPAFLLLQTHHQSATATNPFSRLCALVTYYPRDYNLSKGQDQDQEQIKLPSSTSSSATTSCYSYLPLLPIQIHLAGPQSPSFWHDQDDHPTKKRHQCHIFFYPESEPGFAEHSSQTYDCISSRLAWSRALECIKRGFGWPGGSWVIPEVETIWDKYWKNFREKKKKQENHAANTMRTMVGGEGVSDNGPDSNHQCDEMPFVNCVPTMAGGTNHPSISTFYTKDFFPAGPPSQHIRLLSRTVGSDRIVDEILLSFRHTEEIPWLLPRVPPTDREVRVILVLTASFSAGKIARQNIYWDQASVLMQIGLLDPALVPGSFRATGKTREGRDTVERIPVVGAEGVERVLL